MHKTQFDLHTVVDISYSFSYDCFEVFNLNRFVWQLKRGNFCSRLSPKHIYTHIVRHFVRMLVLPLRNVMKISQSVR